jgi:hypothetical protein
LTLAHFNGKHRSTKEIATRPFFSPINCCVEGRALSARAGSGDGWGKRLGKGGDGARMMGSGEDKGFKIYSISVQQIDCVRYLKIFCFY